MPACVWSVAVEDALNAIDTRFPGRPSALAGWARFGVEHLHYLLDLDSARSGPDSAAPHTAQTIDYAHGHWATVTAITTVDRCAAALGEGLLGPKTSGHAYDLADCAKPTRLAKISSISAPAEQWINAVSQDPEYQVMIGFRNPLVHAEVSATAQMTTRQTTPRNALTAQVNGTAVRVSVDMLVERCRAFAKTHVESFLRNALSPGF